MSFTFDIRILRRALYGISTRISTDTFLRSTISIHAKLSVKNSGQARKTFRMELLSRKIGSRAAQGGVLAALLVAGFLVSALRCVAATCTSPPAGLAGWWPAEGNANDIIGTNNGSLIGGVTAGAAGMVGTTFTFDGTNGYVQIPDAPALKPTNLTIECWVRFTSLDSAGSG